MNSPTFENMPHIALTAGEPAGIGPDLCVQLAQQTLNCRLTVIADPALLQQRAGLLGLPLQITTAGSVHHPGQLAVQAVDLAEPVVAGQLNSANAGYVLETLNIACDGCLSGDFTAMVTAPVQKSVINDAGHAFSGHTEYLAERSSAALPIMMLTAATEPELRVALVTTHLPLRDVAAAITPRRLAQTLDILHHDLQRDFGIAAPRILVCGLNPHAGEGGHLGDEEIEIIEPVLEQQRRQGRDIVGPLPADTLFTAKYLNTADAVLAMYHDQGLPVLKHAGFGRAVNVTLGLPIIRTSVDHGTALDLAGSGKANSGSLQEALTLAIRLSNQRTNA